MSARMQYRVTVSADEHSEVIICKTQKETRKTCLDQAAILRKHGYRLFGRKLQGYTGYKRGGSRKKIRLVSVEQVDAATAAREKSSSIIKKKKVSVDPSVSVPTTPPGKRDETKLGSFSLTSRPTLPSELQSAQWDETEQIAFHVPRILLYGPPGTGKSTLAHYIAAKRGVPCLRLPLTEETPASELRGHFIHKGNDGFQWMDGPMAIGWTSPSGAVVCVDEIDKACADALTMLYAFLDDPEVAHLTLPTGRQIRPTSGFQVVATMNGTPDDLPEALADRFNVKLKITEPNPYAIMRLPKRLWNAAKGTAALEDPSRRITMRQWIAFADLIEKLGEKLAAKAVFGKRARSILDSLRIAGGR